MLFSDCRTTSKEKMLLEMLMCAIASVAFAKSSEFSFLVCSLCNGGQFLCSTFFMCKQFARSSALSGWEEKGITYKIWKSFYLLTMRCSSERMILILSAYRKRMACFHSIDLRNFANCLWPSTTCCPERNKNERKNAIKTYSLCCFFCVFFLPPSTKWI